MTESSVTNIDTNAKRKPVPLLSILSMTFFHVFFYGVIVIIVYWMLTLNYHMLIASALVTFLQSFVPAGRRNWYRNFVMNYMKPQQYFYIDRIYEQELPKDQKTMYGFHPHSIFCYGMQSNLNQLAYPTDKLTYAVPLGSRFMLSMPIVGLHFKFWGIQAVNPQNLGRLMHKGQDIALVPGGFEQATITTPKQMRIFIKSRKGFIKYALKYNYTIRPVIITNQHKAMKTLDAFTNIRLLLNKIKIPGVIYWCNYGLLFPPGVVMNLIIGKAIKGIKIYDKKQHPTHHQINVAHSEYIQQIKRIYEVHKQKNGNVPLVIY